MSLFLIIETIYLWVKNLFPWINIPTLTYTRGLSQVF